jgi:hypothetical protein
MRTLVVALAFILSGTATLPRNQAEPIPPTLNYYMAARASYQNSSQIEVAGQTSLPPGAIITAQVFNFVGVGAEALSAKATMAVKQDQTFLAWLSPRTGKKFSFTAPGRNYPHNPICEITFDPTAPQLPSSTTSAQPVDVLRVVGKYGHGLSKAWGSNPLLYCGKAICFLQVDVPVTD